MQEADGLGAQTEHSRTDMRTYTCLSVGNNDVPYIILSTLDQSAVNQFVKISKVPSEQQ